MSFRDKRKHNTCHSLYIKGQYYSFQENIDGVTENKCSLNLSKIALIEMFCYPNRLCTINKGNYSALFQIIA